MDGVSLTASSWGSQHWLQCFNQPYEVSLNEKIVTNGMSCWEKIPRYYVHATRYKTTRLSYGNIENWPSQKPIHIPLSITINFTFRTIRGVGSAPTCRGGTAGQMSGVFIAFFFLRVFSRPKRMGRLPRYLYGEQHVFEQWSDFWAPFIYFLKVLLCV